MTSEIQAPPTTQIDKAKPPRLASLDQFRGYTVVGMILVNYFGFYDICPQIFKHSNDYCSYADTIMPQFLFAVGFALRLTYGRRDPAQGNFAAIGRMTRRLLGLVLISVIVYRVSPPAELWEPFSELSGWQIISSPLKRDWFQTLMHIAVTSLWLLPVLKRSWRVRILWMVASLILHAVLTYQFNFTWVYTPPTAVDGGPLGFLTWCIPALVGTLACDYFIPPRGAQPAASPNRMRVLITASVLMLAGYALSCGTRFYDVPVDQVASLAKVKLAADPVWPSQTRVADKLDHAQGQDWFAEPPFVRPPSPQYRKWNYWMMCQRVCTPSYVIFSAGLSLLVFLIFYIACDVFHWQLPLFRTFGTNALFAYIVHELVGEAVHPFFPKDAPAWYALPGLLIFFAITWVFVTQLEKQGVYLRV